MLETGVTLPCSRCAFGVDLFEICEHRADRCMQAVKVKTVEPYLLLICREVIIVRAKPSHKIKDIGITPHPGRKPFETAESLDRVFILTHRAHVTVDPIGIRKIGLYRDGRKPFLPNQSFRYLGALAI